MIIIIALLTIIVITIVIALVLILSNNKKSVKRIKNEIVHTIKKNIPISEAKYFIALSYPPQFIKTFDKTLLKSWKTSEKILYNVLKYFDYALRYAMSDINSKIITSEFETFITNYSTELIDRINNIKKYNWELHTIISAKIFGYYLLLQTSNKYLNQMCASLIIMMSGYPTHVLGKSLSGIKSMMMLGPNFLASAYLDRLDDLLTTDEYITTRDYYLNLSRSDKTITRDGIFINKQNEIDVQFQFSLLDPSISYMYLLDSNMYNPSNEINILKRQLIHPTIKMSSPGISINQTNLELDVTPSNLDPQHGIVVIPSIGYIRYFDKTYQFNVRGQTNNIAFASPNTMGISYWIHYRNVHTHKSLPNLKFPDVGFITLRGETNHTHLDPNMSFIEPQSKCSVFQHEHYGFLFQNYRINRLGNYIVTEFICIDETLEIITIILTINNMSKLEYTYHSQNGTTKLSKYRDELYQYHIGPMSMATFKTVFNLKRKEVKVKKVDTHLKENMVKYNNYSIKSSNEYSILYLNSNPILAMSHMDDIFDKEIYTINIDNITHMFMHNSKNNQHEILPYV